MPNPNTYETGTKVRCSVTFTANGADTDPDSVTARLKTPDGVEVAYVEGTDSELVRDSAGKFHFDTTPTQAGWHYYRFEGVGTVDATSQRRFYAEPSAF